MSMIKEFKEFVFKGNILDLAVAVIIGAAFGAIVTSLVDDIVTPLLLQPALKAAQVEDLDKLAWNGVKWGKFLAAVIKFLLVALVLFSLVKAVNRANRKKAAEVAAPAIPELTLTEKLLTDIRDNLKR